MSKQNGKRQRKEEGPITVAVRVPEIEPLVAVAKTYMDVLCQSVPDTPYRRMVLHHLQLFYEKCRGRYLEIEAGGMSEHPEFSMQFTARELMVFATAIEMYAHLVRFVNASRAADMKMTLSRATEFYQRLFLATGCTLRGR